jgi:hypothetical protein
MSHADARYEVWNGSWSDHARSARAACRGVVNLAFRNRVLSLRLSRRCV